MSADTAELRKARGAFFTPEPIAQFIVDWAVRSADDSVIEPSCGEAAFLVPAARRLRALGNMQPVVSGVDIHAASAETARQLVAAAGAEPDIVTSDFFLVPPVPKYDAAVGNPPFIRYQDFAGPARAVSRMAALQAGVPISGLASSWAAFVVHTALFLKRGGRMGLVIPAELLAVNYAAVIRTFLLERFDSVALVMFTERVFPGVQEDVVLLLADGFGGSTDHATIFQSQNGADLATLTGSTVWRPLDPAGKWTPALLTTDALASYGALLRDGAYTHLETWGDTTLGMVTGNNKYFSLSPARVAELGLHRTDIVRLSPPGSAHLRGLALSPDNLTRLGRRDQATYLFRPAGEPSPEAWAYIRAGETAGVHLAYKCRVRSPWWRVPLVRPADLLLTYMNADTARLTTNSAGVRHLNSVHGVYLRDDYRDLGRELLPLASLTTMTLLGAETVGRSYGGGVLKLEPKEGDQLPVPSPELVTAVAPKLAPLKNQVAGLLQRGRLLDAVALVDAVVLTGELGVSSSELAHLRGAHAELTARRYARAKSE